jgi:hypothetical protein
MSHLYEHVNLQVFLFYSPAVTVEASFVSVTEAIKTYFVFYFQSIQSSKLDGRAFTIFPLWTDPNTWYRTPIFTWKNQQDENGKTKNGHLHGRIGMDVVLIYIVVCLCLDRACGIINLSSYLCITYRSSFFPKGVAEASHIVLQDAHILPE